MLSIQFILMLFELDALDNSFQTNIPNVDRNSSNPIYSNDELRGIQQRQSPKQPEISLNKERQNLKYAPTSSIDSTYIDKGPVSSILDMSNVSSTIQKIDDQGLFSPNVLDPLLDSEKADIIKKRNSFIMEHDRKTSVGGDSKEGLEQFGDISIMSLNSHSSNDLVFRKMADYVIDMIDTSHVSLFGLQSVSLAMLESLLSKLNNKDHYDVYYDEKCFGIDIGTNIREYYPIIYDKSILKFVKGGCLEATHKLKQKYGSYGLFEDTRYQRLVTVANIDLYQISESYVETQFKSLLKRLEDERIMNNNLFIIGSINSFSDNMKDLIVGDDNYKKGFGFINVLDKDPNNKNFSRLTLHNHKKLHLDREVDYILYREEAASDGKGLFVNYSRILSKADTEMFEHYPVISILGYKVDEDVDGSSN